MTLAYDLVYSRQGSRDVTTSPLGYGSNEITMKVDYLSLPLLLRYQVGGGRFWVGGGLQAGYLLRDKNYDSQFGEVAALQWNLAFFHRIDLGLTAALGYRLGKHMLLSTRYYSSIRPMNAPDPQTGTYGPDVYKLYNRTWSTNLAYYFW